MPVINGTINNDNLVGSSVDDIIDDGNGGSDTINALEGNDQITVTGGNDGVTGGTGTDTLIIDWSTSISNSFMSTNPNVPTGSFSATYANNDGRSVGVNTIENIVFIGGSGNDAINSGGGIDSLNGGAGDDTLDVGQGTSDSADGGANIDRLGISFIDRGAGISIDLNAGGNQLLAGSGTISNFEGFTTVTGSNFNDTIVSSNADIDETLNGGVGNDVIEVRNGSDSVAGGDGSDTLVINWATATTTSFMSVDPNVPTGTFTAVYQNNDGRSVGVNGIERIQFFGGSGSDTITSGGGIDSLNGGAGDDTLSVGRGSSDSADGGANTDRLGINFVDRLGAVSINLNLGGNQMVAGLGTIANFEGFSSVTGSNFGDTIISTNAVINETINGGTGDDVIEVRNGADTVTGGDGIDTLVINWSASTTTSFMSVGPNSPTGTFSAAYQNNDGRFVSANTIENLHFFGGSGMDTIVAGGGMDNLNGGAGNDSLDVGRGLTDSADGGADIDRLGVSFVDRGSAISINLNRTGEQLVAGAGSFTNFEGFSTITGTAFNDTIRSTNSVLNETLNGGDGDDLFEVRNGADTVSGGAGNDTLVINWSASVANSFMSVNPNSPTGTFSAAYQNNDGRFVSVSGIENIEFTGGSGNDVVNVAGGTDILNGGLGNDMLDVGRGSTDSANGGGGTDRLGINFIDRLAGVSINLNLAGNQLVAGLGSISNFEGFSTVTGSNFGDTIVSSNSNINETLIGGNGDDVIEVRNGSDNVTGGAGTDTLVIDWSASVANSFMSASPNVATGSFSAAYANNDGRNVSVNTIENIQFIGGSGADAIVSGGGTDILNGGAGNDTLDVGRGITDSADGGANTDRLGINFIDRSSGVSVNLNLAGNQLVAGSGTITNFEGFSAVTATNFADTLITTNTVIGETINVGNGNDVIEVRNGADSVNGGAGVDTLVINWSASTSNSFMSVNPNVPSGSFSAVYANNDGRSVSVSEIERIQFFGGSGNDSITTGGAIDNLNGGAGNDTIVAGAGNDVLNGGAGKDTLSGGVGRDSFLFRLASDFNATRPDADVITDFNQVANERINIALIDANTTVGGDQDFEWIGTGAFSNTAGELRYEQSGGNTFIEGDWDGNGTVDFVIQLNGLYTLDAGDFAGVNDLFP